MTPAPALLVLEDGRTFHGHSYGAPGETFGEAVFSTGMTGYQETLTDPSYHRQVVVMTAPHVGNTGMNDEDPESSRIWVSGYVVRDPARLPSSWRSRRSLDDALRDEGVVGISGIDTRALTRHLRERGAMRVGISSSETDPVALRERVLASAGMSGANLSEAVSTAEPYVVAAEGEKRFTVAAVDLGLKANTPRMMSERGIEVHVLPATASLEQVQAVGADGLFFSNGPGDPAATTAQVELLQGALAAGLPYFGICFGNQLFGRALGFDTYKLTYGHRGINQPVMDRTTSKVEVTAHNHGFAVDAPLDRPTTTPYGEAAVSHVCLNDDVVEGLELRDDGGGLKAFSVQYHPEAAAGPHDAAYLFDRFCELMSERARTEPARDEEGARRSRSVDADRELASETRDASRDPVRRRTTGGAGGFETGARAPSSTTGASAPSSTTGASAPSSTTGASAPSSTTGTSEVEEVAQQPSRNPADGEGA